MSLLLPPASALGPSSLFLSLSRSLVRRWTSRPAPSPPRQLLASVSSPLRCPSLPPPSSRHLSSTPLTPPDVLRHYPSRWVSWLQPACPRGTAVLRGRGRDASGRDHARRAACGSRAHEGAWRIVEFGGEDNLPMLPSHSNSPCLPRKEIRRLGRRTQPCKLKRACCDAHGVASTVQGRIAPERAVTTSHLPSFAHWLLAEFSRPGKGLPVHRRCRTWVGNIEEGPARARTA